MAMEVSSDEDYSQVESQREERDEAALVSMLGERVAKQLIQAHSLGMVSKKNDLITERPHRKHWAMVKHRAQLLIREAFGFALVELAYDKDVLVFVVDRETLTSSEYIDDECRFEKIFLFVVLGYLTLKGPPVAEGQILEFLRKLGIESGETSFGNALNLLSQKLPAQYYLKRTKEVDHAGSGEAIYRYDWGPRSIAEVDKDQLLNQFSTILGKPVRSFVQLDSQGRVLN